MRLLDKIDSYLDSNFVSESYSKEMLDVFPKDLLKKLSRDLSGWLHMDIQNTTFEELDKSEAVPVKIRDKFVICFYKSSQKYVSDGYAIVGHEDDGKTRGVITASNGYDKIRSKKAAIENADKIFLIKKEGFQSNWDIKKLRAELKADATALTRNDDNGWASNLDKSGYDLTKARRDLRDRLYAHQKDERSAKVIAKFKSLVPSVVNYLNDLANGKIPEWKETNDAKKKIEALMKVVDRLSIYKDEIPEYAMDEIEKALGI